MIKQVVFAVGADEFEKKIIEYLNAEDGENQYVLAHSATHLDGLEDVCARLRPQILVVREGLGDQKIDILDLVRKLKMSITGLHIVVLARSRQPGDPFLMGLVMYQIYDFIATGKMSVQSVGDLILSPHSIQDVSNYVPEINLEQNGTQFSFSSPGEKSEGEKVGESFSNDSPLQDITDSYRAVNHVSTLNEIDTHEDETSLFTEKQNKANGYVNVGSKLSYNPLFQPVAKKQEEHRPVLTRETPQLFSDDEEDLSIDNNKKPQQEVASGKKQTAERDERPRLEDIVAPRRSPESRKPIEHREEVNERPVKTFEQSPQSDRSERIRGYENKRPPREMNRYSNSKTHSNPVAKEMGKADAREIDFNGLFSLYNNEELNKQVDLLKGVLARASSSMLDDPLSVNEKAVSVLTALFKEASVENKKRPTVQQPKNTIPVENKSVIAKPFVQKEEKQQGAVEEAEKPLEDKPLETLEKKQTLGLHRSQQEAISQASQDHFQKQTPSDLSETKQDSVTLPEAVPTPYEKKDAQQVPQASPELSKTESVDERLQRLTTLRGMMAEFDPTPSVSEPEVVLEQIVAEPVNEVEKQSEEDEAKEPKKVIAFLRDGVNDNMVSFNVFADFALTHKKCVYVRYKQKDAEDFQFDTLKDKGCNIEMLENPNLYELKGKIEDETISHIVIDIPTSTDFRYTQQVLELADTRIVDIDQNVSRAKEHAFQVKNILNGLDYIVMIAGYNPDRAEQSVSKIMGHTNFNKKVVTIDNELMQEGLGDDPYALVHPSDFYRNVKEMF